MDRIDLIRTFVRVVERGSFSSVARELGLGQPAVSKQVAALEADLGAELIRRTSRRMALTDAGQDFYEAALRLLYDFDAAASRLGRGQSALSGLVADHRGAGVRRPADHAETGRLLPPLSERVGPVHRHGEAGRRDRGGSGPLRLQRRGRPTADDRAQGGYGVGGHRSHARISRRARTPRSAAELEAHDGVGFSPEGAPRPWTFAGGQVHVPGGWSRCWPSSRGRPSRSA